MVTIKTTIQKGGNRFLIHIPRALIDCEILQADKKYRISIEELKGLMYNSAMKRGLLYGF